MFHTPEYVDYLEKVSSKNVAKVFEKNSCKIKSSQGSA